MGYYKRYYSRGQRPIKERVKVSGSVAARGGLAPGAVYIDKEYNMKFEEVLRQFEEETRRKALKAGLRKAGAVVARRARQLVPPRGKVGDDGLAVPLNRYQRESKPLKNMIRTAIRDKYSKQPGGSILAVVGPEWKGQGMIAHLVEGYPSGTKHSVRHMAGGRKASGTKNRPTGGYLYPQPFMRPAADQTQMAQRAAMLKELEKQARAAGPGPLKNA